MYPTYIRDLDVGELVGEVTRTRWRQLQLKRTPSISRCRGLPRRFGIPPEIRFLVLVACFYRSSRERERGRTQMCARHDARDSPDSINEGASAQIFWNLTCHILYIKIFQNILYNSPFVCNSYWIFSKLSFLKCRILFNIYKFVWKPTREIDSELY